jgi:RNA polymerase sigma-70 factor (ECF subfamily)
MSRDKASISSERQTAGRDGEKDDADDRALVARAQKGDAAAFRTIFERYRRRAYALALGVVHNPDAALDVVQEAFPARPPASRGLRGQRQRLHLALPDRHERRPSTTCASKGGHAHVDYDDAVAHLENQAPARRGRPDSAAGARQSGEGAARREIREKIDEALGQLSANHRAVLVMREVDGLSYEEMAKVMKCSKGTIMSRLFHARKNMQRFLVELLARAAARTRLRCSVEHKLDDETLMRWLDGDLPRDEAREAERMVAASPELRMKADSLAQLREVMTAHYGAAADEADAKLEGLWARSRRRCGRRRRARRRRRGARGSRACANGWRRTGATSSPAGWRRLPARCSPWR